MGARELLAELSDAGLSVTADAGKLVVRPVALLTDSWRARLRDAKPDLLALLAADDAPAEPPAQPEPMPTEPASVEMPAPAPTVHHAPLDVAAARAAMHRLGYRDAGAEGQLQATLQDVSAAVVAAELGELADERDGVTTDEAEARDRRIVTFARFGIEREQASELAQRLLVRDRECDDRRMCVECARLKMIPAGRGRVTPFCRHHSQIVQYGYHGPAVLFRCDGFLGAETR